MSEEARQEPSSPPAPRRSGRRLWPLWLALLPLLLSALAVLAAHVAGLRVQGAGWNHGPTLALWQLYKSDCLSLQGEGMSLSALRSLRIDLDHLDLHGCEAAPSELKPPPWTPAFDLHVSRFVTAGLPPLTLDVRQREQRWHVVAAHAESRLTADYDRQDGLWQLAGTVQARHLQPELLGQLVLTGAGHWRADRLDGKARVQGTALGAAGRPQRADAWLDAGLSGRAWTLDAGLSAPLALPAGWQLSSDKAVHASGDFEALTGLQADLRAQGPQGQARLLLSGDQGLAGGQGRLSLSGRELAGTLPLRWQGRTLTLAPAGLMLPQALQLTLPTAVVIPLAASGHVSLPLLLHYQGLKLSSTDSVLAWGEGDWSWQGALALSGQHSGLLLDARWQGRAGPQGLSGPPLRLRADGRGLALTAELPVNGIRAPGWPLLATFRGRYGDYPLQGSLSARRQGGLWLGELQALSRLALYDKGGALDLRLPWQLRDAVWQASPGARLNVAEGLKGTLLVKPLSITARTPLQPAQGGLRGELNLAAGGLVAARAGVPALTGTVTLAGREGRAQLLVGDWQSRIGLVASADDKGAHGSATVDTPLLEAMSKGLGFTLKQGQINAAADWTWRDALALDGSATIAGLALDWGGIKASGGQGRLRLGLRGSQVTLASEGPLTVAELDVGTAVTQISLGLNGDLSSWQFSDVSAHVLGGLVSAPALHWPAADYQTISLAGIDLARVVALQGQDSPPVQLDGTVAGELPVQLGKTSLSLRNGSVHNEVPLTLRITPSAGVTAMSQSNRAVQLALDTLSHMLVSDFHARLDMAADGWLDAAVTIKGDSVQPNRQPVVLNYTHRENVLELLRSLRMSDEISQQFMDRQKLKP